MKRLSALMACAALLPAAHAEDDRPLTRAEMFDYCKTVAGVARNIMKVRQAGVPMLKAMEPALDKPAVQAIVEAAYAVPRIPPDFPDLKESAITDFEDRQYAACLKGISKQ